MDDQKQIRMISWAYIGVAFGMVLFWLGFYTQLIFPVETLGPLIKNYDGYYAWETSFTIPDLVMALCLIIGATRLLNNQNDRAGKLVLTSAIGASIFLGVLDFVYAIRNGMYELGHFFSQLLQSIGVGLPILGIISLAILIKIEKKLYLESDENASN